MSLMSTKTSDETAKCSTILKTADQYVIWKARVADVCWAATHKSIFDITRTAWLD